MNLRKKLVSLISIITFIVFIIAQGVVYAETTTNVLYLGITELRQSGTPPMGYAIGDPNTNQETGTAAKIWNIVQYSTSTSNDPTEGNIYCLKAGIGFTDVNRRATYDVFYDMKTQRKEIAAKNAVLKSIVEGNLDAQNGKTSLKYNALLALIDMLYIKEYPGMSSGSMSTAEERAQLLENAGIRQEDWSAFLTDEDIMAIQQSAIWYFTNYKEENGKYDKTTDTGWLNYTLDGNNYDSLSGYNPTSVEPGRSDGTQRQQQAEILYNYLIRTAKTNADKYENAGTQGAPATVDTKTLNYVEDGANYVIGPIHITEKENNGIPYTIDFLVKNGGNTTTDYQLLDTNKNQVASGTTVTDLVGQDFYISMAKDKVTTVGIDIAVNYKNTKMTLWANNTNGDTQPVLIPKKENVSVPLSLTVTPNQKIFDLALRKYITKVNGVELTGANTRVPVIDETTLTSGTTATYKHKKDPIAVAKGDKVTYKITIYNEGEKTGRATKVVDQLPTGLKYSKVVSGNFELDSYSENDNTLNLKRKADNTTNLPAYIAGNLSSETIEIECEVTATPDMVNQKVLTNVAWISEALDADSNIIITNQTGADRDSEPATKPSVNKDTMSDYTGNNNKADLTDSTYYYKGQQDDDDFEKLILLPESFDLKLIKRIVAVNNQNVPERIESIDVSKLNTLDSEGNMITTGEYNLNKEPVAVKKGDIVTYTFRIYNEGTIDGYASEITEDIPTGLQFIWSEKTDEELKEDTTLTDEEKAAIEFNQKYLWGKFVYDESKENIVQISTDYLSKENETTVGGNLIPAFGKNDGTKTEDDISYKEVSVMLKVISEDVTGTIIRNEAAISEDSDKDGNPVDDRDSSTENWVKYEDDEDYDNIVLKSFDLALRKFIIAVSNDNTIESKEYLKNEDGSYKRAPVVDTSKLNTKGEDGKVITTATYNHTKEPVLVKSNDTVVYMLRVYNEGDMDGYASEIKDHLPEYLEFVDGEFNEKYGWTVSEDGRTVTTRYLEDTIITKATKDNDDKYVLSYKEIPIMCQVKENAKTSINITNIADITEYLDENKKPVNDRDSQPDNVVLPSDEELPNYKGDETGTYVPGQQDDDDFEKIIIKNFDLALRKWVTQAIVIENGNQTITETGHQPYDDPEEIVKVELHRKKLNQVTVKFRYSIRVINEGEIEGYAKEVTDYVPEGLKFVAEDNPGWTDEGNNVISTRLLENTLLQPGEYADVEVVLTWINSENNMGVMKNVAEISEDYNKHDIPDKDSTPDNQKPGEDDIDDASVMLSISTGQVRIYFTLGFIVLITIAGGVILIKKYVL